MLKHIKIFFESESTDICACPEMLLLIISLYRKVGGKGDLIQFPCIVQYVYTMYLYLHIYEIRVYPKPCVVAL